MIEIQIEGPAQPSDWDALARRCGANPLHCPAPHRLDQGDDAFRFLRFVREGQVLGCALAFDQRPGGLRRWVGGRRTLRLPSAPALEDALPLDEALRALRSWAAAEGYANLQIGASGSALPHQVEPARRSHEIVEFTLDLRRDHEAVFGSYHKQHRKNVRRAQRQELRVVEDSGVDGLLRLRTMQLSSSDRAEQRAEGFGVPDPATFQRLHEFVYGPGIGHVLFAYEGEEAIAALAWLSCYGRVLTVRSGSLAKGYELRAMYLLYDELIRRSIEEGCVELNAGGVPREAADPSHSQSGLYEFKQGFGTVAHERAELEFDLAGEHAQ